MTVESLLTRYLIPHPIVPAYASSSAELEIYYQQIGGKVGQVISSGVEVSLDSSSTPRYANFFFMVPPKEDGTDGILQ